MRATRWPQHPRTRPLDVGVDVYGSPTESQPAIPPIRHINRRRTMTAASGLAEPDRTEATAAQSIAKPSH